MCYNRSTYGVLMKRKDLEKFLTLRGYVLERNGGRHDVWRKEGKAKKIAVPRHNEINELLAKAIKKQAQS